MLLEDWFLAIEDGTAQYRYPSAAYPKTWTEEELDTLVRDIDAEIDQEVVRQPGTSVGAKAGPGFQRLELTQRLALAQQLHALVQKHASILPRSLS